MGEGTAGLDPLRSIFRARPRARCGRPVQCGFLLGRAADKRVRHPHGVGRSEKDVLRIVLASAAVSVGSGVLVGLALSFGLNRVISRWVENTTHDPLLILGVSS